jgi:hypothetical protein
VDSLVSPVVAGYDTLRPSSFLIGCDPMYASDNAEVILIGDFLVTGGWVGPDAVGVRVETSPGQVNLVFVTLELHRLNGDPAALQSFLNQVLENDFNW